MALKGYYRLTWPLKRKTQGEGKNHLGEPNNYQPSEPTADACLTEQSREMRTLTDKTTIMN